MKLHWSPRSPFVRKVMVLAHETGLAERIEPIRTPVALTEPNAALMTQNPLSKIPTLILDDGTILYDSPVICEYLDTLHPGPKLVPVSGAERWTALRRQALGDGLLDILILWRYERERSPERQSKPINASYQAKVAATLDFLDGEAEALAAAPLTVGSIAIGCALSYLDFRYPDLEWRGAHPRIAAWHAAFAARPSMKATEPVDDR